MEPRHAPTVRRAGCPVKVQRSTPRPVGSLSAAGPLCVARCTVVRLAGMGGQILFLTVFTFRYERPA